MRKLVNSLKILGLALFTQVGSVLAQESPKIALPNYKFGQPEKLNVNTDQYHEILPVLFPDEKTLVFSVREHPENSGGNKDRVDVWFATKDSASSYATGWSKPLRQGQFFNNSDFNFVSSIAGDATHLILGNTYKEDGDMSPGPSVTYWNSKSWDFPKKVNVEEFENTDPQYNFNLSRDGNVMIMSLKGYGKENRDLYVSFKKDQNTYTWSKPMNLGAEINTDKDEVTAYLCQDGKTMFFSTNGRPDGLGDFDIYVTKRLDDTWQKWTKPRNIGAPVNTSASEMYFALNALENRGYWSMGENGAQADLYVTAVRKNVIATVVLVDQTTGQPVAGTAKYTNFEGKEVTVQTDTTAGSYGSFQMEIEPGKSYPVSGTAPLYLEGSGTIGVPADFEGETVTQKVPLPQSDALARALKNARSGLGDDTGGKVLTLKNVLFDVGKYNLRPESIPVLDEAYETISSYGPDVKIRVEGHTDSDGGRAMNERLSLNRAKTVAEYLVNKGLKKDNVSYKGYAFDKPVAKNDTPANKQLNRRTEVVIEN
jgi:outer membrane protein OmpA-like peptidoglycan-associated protein